MPWRGQAVEDALDQRRAGDRQRRLGAIGGQRTQPRAEAGREDERPVGAERGDTQRGDLLRLVEQHVGVGQAVRAPMFHEERPVRVEDEVVRRRARARV